MMSHSYQPSPFIDAAAVEAWDAWFRWRDHGQLRDVSIDATWQRIATSLAAAETDSVNARTQQILGAISQWRLVLDERLLSTLGTGRGALIDDPVAVLNAAAFVSTGDSTEAAFDFAMLHEVAGLALRCLDNAAILLPAAGLSQNLRIGLIGVADALALLATPFDSAAGRACAAAMARALAEGCLAANIQLAAQRGAQSVCNEALLDILHRRAMPAELLASANQHGLRYRQLTAITAHPRLALFANNVSDALDPMPQRATKSNSRTEVLNTPVVVSIEAQLELRGAMQPWIDAPIEYPIRVPHAPDPSSISRYGRLAAAHDLGELCWRVDATR